MKKSNNIQFGWAPSKLDGTEDQFKLVKNLKVPEKYSFKDHMPPVLNQGSTNKCVTYSIGAHIDWNINMDNKTYNKDNRVDRDEIYSARSIPGDRGMTFKEALSYIKHNGVNTSTGRRKIDHYAMIGSPEVLKQALIVNGPCIGGLMTYNTGDDFWNKYAGDQALGGHAISIVGYDEKGFIIRNSWGTSYGDKGYMTIPYSDFDKILECWTIID